MGIGYMWITLPKRNNPQKQTKRKKKMAVSWKVVEVLPENLQKTLEEYTNERWRVLQICPSPAAEPTYNSTRFTVVGYRMTYEKGNRRREDDDVETQ